MRIMADFTESYGSALERGPIENRPVCQILPQTDARYESKS